MQGNTFTFSDVVQHNQIYFANPDGQWITWSSGGWVEAEPEIPEELRVAPGL